MDPRPLDEDPRPKVTNQGQSYIHGSIFVGKSIGLDPKKRAHDLENQDPSSWVQIRIQFASNEWKLVPKDLNPGPHLKWDPK